MSSNNEFLKIQNWYPYFSSHTFPTSFVRLRPEAVALLAADDDARQDIPRAVSRQVVADLRLPMSRISGNCFTSTDMCAPTDTERFRKKHGAVFSPESAWTYLFFSEKIRRAAAAGNVSFICLILMKTEILQIFRMTMQDILILLRWTDAKMQDVKYVFHLKKWVSIHRHQDIHTVLGKMKLISKEAIL